MATFLQTNTDKMRQCDRSEVPSMAGDDQDQKWCRCLHSGDPSHQEREGVTFLTSGEHISPLEWSWHLGSTSHLEDGSVAPASQSKYKNVIVFGALNR